MTFDLKNTIVASYFEARQDGNSVVLLPVGHSRHFPLAFDINSRQVSKGELNFYNSVFHKNFSPERHISPDQCEVVINTAADSVKVLNVLDNCFGHSLLKLFYAAQLMSKDNSCDYLVILPKAMKHFLPSKKGLNLLIINYSFSKLEGCFVLNNEIKRITEKYSQASYEGVDTYGVFDTENLKKQLNLTGNATTQKEKSIIFYYRSDYFRMWDGKRQKKHIVELFTFLRSYFSGDIKFMVLGDKDNVVFPSWITDERTNGFSESTDWKYNSTFSNSITCIGLTGSHMLFPSVFCESTVHLHNTMKYKNMAEDVVPVPEYNTMLNAYRHLYYYGNNNCSDITPKKLGTLVLLHYQGLIEKKYKISDTSSMGQAEWIKSNYPFFDYAGVNKFRAAFNAKQSNKTKWRYYFDKISPFT